MRLQHHADELAAMHAALKKQAGRLSELSASRGRLVGQVLQAEEVERRRLAEALHDEALQELLAARQGLAPVDDARAERARDSVGRAIDQLRGTIFDLHPAVLEHAGLAAALSEVADNQAAKPGSAPRSTSTPTHAATMTRCCSCSAASSSSTPPSTQGRPTSG